MTNARERFAREVAAGKSQADAYREAFPRSRNWKPETLHKRASELAATGEVLGRVAELRREADAAAIMECSELRTILTARVRNLAETDGPTVDLCRASDSLARVSGWHSPDALAVAVSGVAFAPGDKGRRICNLLGVSFDAVQKMNYDEAWNLFRDAMGIPVPTQEERERRIRAILGVPEDDEPELPRVDEERPEPPPPPALPPPRPAVEWERTEAGDGDGGEVEMREPVDGRAEAETPEPEPEAVPAAVEPEPVAVEETPERRERIARILAYVQRRGASTRDEARAVALTFEGGSVIGSEATAVADAWEAEPQTGGDND